MIKLSANYGLKVPGSEKYSSRCASASIEIEVDDLSPHAAKDKLAALWATLRASVEQELHGTQSHKTAHNPVSPNASKPTNGEAATQKQITYLLSVARRFKDWAPSQTIAWVKQVYGSGLDALTKKQAGQAIDNLQGR